MLDQSFALSDILKVIILAFIEILLSTDNAIVLGVLAAPLPEKLRKKALYIGALSAFVIRALALLSISFLLEYRWIQVLGALYLIYLSVRYFIKKKRSLIPSVDHSFWKTVILIELFDLAFAVDSIVAGIAFIGAPPPHHLHPKLWIVYIGGIIGLLGIRYAAHLFSDLIHKFPRLETSAHLLIGVIGFKLAYNMFPNAPSLEPTFWGATILFLFFGFTKRK